MTTGQVIELLRDALRPAELGVVNFTVISESIFALDLGDGTRAVLTVNVQQKVP